MQTFQHLALLALVASAAATCNFGGGGKGNGKKETDTHRCTPRSDGKWTITMETSLVDVPNPGQPSGTTESVTDFYLYDAKCIQHDGWSKPSCGVPYHADNNPNLKKDLVVDHIFADVGSPYMHVNYGGKGITATCNKHSSGLEAFADCQAYFDN